MTDDDKKKLAEIEERWDPENVNTIWSARARTKNSEIWKFKQYKPFGGNKYIVAYSRDQDPSHWPERVVAEVHWGGNSQIEALCNCREDVWWLIERVKELAEETE